MNGFQFRFLAALITVTFPRWSGLNRISTVGASSARVQILKLDVKSGGPTIHALFGRFAPIDPTGQPSLTIRASAGTAAQGCGTGCKPPNCRNCVPSCPYGSGPATFPPTCSNNRTGEPAAPCGNNCTDWTCTKTSTGCCGVCLWAGGLCDHCSTTASCGTS